jgi:endonuclease/exonuclease/phosphatase family metal-dependent hydrolase
MFLLWARPFPETISMKRNSCKFLIYVAVFLIAIAMVVLWGARKIPTGNGEADRFRGSCPATQPAHDSLRVATFNIDGGAEDSADLHGIADCIRGFDLVGLEEVHGNDFASPPDQAHALGNAVHLPALFCPVEHQYWGGKTFGNALLTDLYVRHWKRIPISSKDSDTNRNCILLQCAFADHNLSVIVTHIDRQQDHAPEIRTVASLFLAQPSPAILMGDFNCESSDPDIDKLAHTPAVSDPIGKGYDRIFVRGLKVTASGQTEHHVSDHPMVWADLRME